MKSKKIVFRDAIKVVPLRKVPLAKGVDKVHPLSANELRNQFAAGATTPWLSELLTSYLNVVEGLKSNGIHQLDINEFEVEAVSGLAGFSDNEIIVNL